MMMIRPAAESDLAEILRIYAAAREFMARTGNPTQWAGGYPPESMLRDDIARGQLYVAVEDGAPHAVFALIDGIDPTYLYIEGEWLNDAPYGTIHRIASDGTRHGILPFCVDFGRQRYDNLRIDTHHDNRVMQHLLEKNGFCRCGIIYLENGDPRIAYQWCRV